MEPGKNSFPLDNCIECGQLFTRYSGRKCPECRAAEVRETDTVIAYIKANPGSGADEVAAALNIPRVRVLKYVDEGIFRRYDLSVNHPCKICHVEISHGVICLRCNDKLNQQIFALRETIWNEPGVERLGEPVGNAPLRERKPGDWGNADDLYASSKITPRREQEKKQRRSGGWHR